MAEPTLPVRQRRRHRGELGRIQRPRPAQTQSQRMSAFAEEKGFGKATVTFRLKDWGISRQRYWGTPIPDGVLRERRHRAGGRKRSAGDFARQREGHAGGRISAGECTGLPEHHLSEVRRPGATRDRHDGYLRRFVVVLLSLRRRAKRQSAVRHGKNRLLVSHRSIHWRRRARHPAPDLFALLDQVHARHGPRQERRAHASACSRKAW